MIWVKAWQDLWEIKLFLANKSTTTSRLARLTIAACIFSGAAVFPTVSHAGPTTFGTQIGHALLCMDQLNSNSFYDYLKTYYGPPYQKKDGAYWFRLDNKTFLWGHKVNEVLVGDLTSQVEFIAAVIDTSAENLNTAITKDMGIHYQAIEQSAYPVRESKLGSRIIYAQYQSKVYCAKSKQLLNPSNVPMSLLPHPSPLLNER